MANEERRRLAETAVRDAARRLAEPVESVAQIVAQRAIDLVVEAVDVNALLDRIDVNRLLDQIDVNQLLDRVDVNKLMTKVDVTAVVDQVDVNEILDRVDVSALVDRTDLRPLIAKSSSSLASEGIDVLRSQAVGLDDFFARWVHRLLRRHRPDPVGPPRLVSLQAEP
jgi:hypothetical protein